MAASWISDRNSFSWFWYTSCPDTSYCLRSIGLSVQQKTRKLDFKKIWRPSWMFNRKELRFFFINKLHRYFLPSLESTGLSVQEKKRKTETQGCGYDGHLGFPIGKIVAIFDLLVAPDTSDDYLNVSKVLSSNVKQCRSLPLISEPTIFDRAFSANT